MLHAKVSSFVASKVARTLVRFEQSLIQGWSELILLIEAVLVYTKKI